MTSRAKPPPWEGARPEVSCGPSACMPSPLLTPPRPPQQLPPPQPPAPPSEPTAAPNPGGSGAAAAAAEAGGGIAGGACRPPQPMPPPPPLPLPPAPPPAPPQSPPGGWVPPLAAPRPWAQGALRLWRWRQMRQSTHDGCVQVRLCLDGGRRWNRRLWRRLARAPEAVAGRPEGRPRPGSAGLPRAARRALRRQAQEPSWGAAKRGTLTMLRYGWPAACLRPRRCTCRWRGRRSRQG